LLRRNYANSPDANAFATLQLCIHTQKEPQLTFMEKVSKNRNGIFLCYQNNIYISEFEYAMRVYFLFLVAGCKKEGLLCAGEGGGEKFFQENGTFSFVEQIYPKHLQDFQGKLLLSCHANEKSMCK